MSLAIPDLPACVPPMTLHRAPSFSLLAVFFFIFAVSFGFDRNWISTACHFARLLTFHGRTGWLSDSTARVNCRRLAALKPQNSDEHEAAMNTSRTAAPVLPSLFSSLT